MVPDWLKRFPMILLHKSNGWTTVQLLFEPRDLWIGVYWEILMEMGTQWCTLYITIVPMFPWRIEFPIKRWYQR